MKQFFFQVYRSKVAKNFTIPYNRILLYWNQASLHGGTFLMTSSLNLENAVYIDKKENVTVIQQQEDLEIFLDQYV